VLREQDLELADADARPVLDPALREVVLDEVEAAIVHAANDRECVGWVHGPDGPSFGPCCPIFVAYRNARVKRFLIVNPRSGSDSPTAAELREAARARGIDVHVFEHGQDLEDVARSAEADVLGMAGGDGSLAAVAGVAVERDVPFVCVPYGTRNHFARDIGLDRDDPLAALASFDGVERRVDVGRLGPRLFLNNVSLGVYARLVHRRERHRRRGAALARARALLLALGDHRGKIPFLIDGELVSARVVVVACNPYSFELFSIGERERMDDGLLHLYVPHGVRRVTWQERSARELTIETPRPSMRAAIDGEPAVLRSPLWLRIEPRALRVLVPPG
jgi:diacylglycerol kinase family enzyme